MRRTAHVYVGLLLVAGGGFAYHTAVRGGAPADKEHLTLIGGVFVEPVDARRILVAVTTRTDGASEHLFLYTASRRLTVSPRARNLQATVYYESTGGLRITPALGDYQILEFVVGPDFESHRTDGSLLGFKETLGLVHYVANPRLQAVELEAIHKTGDCDRAPQTCVAVAGQLLPFPG
ncbi:MAG: hypothetical protein E6K29_16535 [Gammaproteobacteria bacterium]|nr:MAG: hypothetical protein E6K29_16535 [Gammaproteobacteria bacterium]